MDNRPTGQRAWNIGIDPSIAFVFLGLLAGITVLAFSIWIHLKLNKCYNEERTRNLNTLSVESRISDARRNAMKSTEDYPTETTILSTSVYNEKQPEVPKETKVEMNPMSFSSGNLYPEPLPLLPFSASFEKNEFFPATSNSLPGQKGKPLKSDITETSFSGASGTNKMSNLAPAHGHYKKNLHTSVRNGTLNEKGRSEYESVKFTSDTSGSKIELDLNPAEEEEEEKYKLEEPLETQYKNIMRGRKHDAYVAMGEDGTEEENEKNLNSESGYLDMSVSRLE